MDYRVSFPNMTLDRDTLADHGGDLPDSVFEVYPKDPPKKGYTCRYEAADETFEGRTPEIVARRIRRFLRSDTAIKSTGYAVIEEIH